MTRITHITHIQVYAMRLNAASVVGMLLVLREQKLQCTAVRLIMMKMIIYNFGHWQARLCSPVGV